MEPDRAFDLLTMAEVADLLHCSKAHICNIATGRVSGCAPAPCRSDGSAAFGATGKPS